MSKYNNVNPDHYKVAGRERPGKADPIKYRVKSTEEKALSAEEEERERWLAKQRQEQRRQKPTKAKT
jgi:hypothetical protein